MPPYVMTYNNLISRIETWVIKTTDPALAAELPAIVDMTERRVARDLKTLMSVQYVTGQMTIGQPLIQKPARWLETVSLQIIANNLNANIYLKEYEYIRKIYPDETALAQPAFYAEFQQGYIYLGPNPDAAYYYQLAYYERPNPLCIENQQNWLTQFAPDLMLIGALCECAPFLVDDNRIAVWEGKYKEKLQEFAIEETRRKVDQSQQEKMP